MSELIIVHNPLNGLKVPSKTVFKGKATFEYLPECPSCGQAGLVALVDFVQHGFSMDNHQLACICGNCEHGAVFIYLVQVED